MVGNSQRRRASSNIELSGSRTGLVTILRGADTSLFGGWGVRI